MGHERIGFLPHTREWNAIVNQLSTYDEDNPNISQIANRTLTAVGKTYAAMPYDESVIKAIKYLATISLSAKQNDQVAFLNSNGLAIDSNLSLYSLVASAQKYISTEVGSLEINKISRDACMQAISVYQTQHQSNQISFLEEGRSIWKSVGNGAAFCELTRNFFASFTERHLNYYLERVAASSISDYKKLYDFSIALSSQSNAIANHAFETTKLVQSYAAGWFNNHAAIRLPDNESVTGFLRHSFGKMREEFRREADGR